MPGTLITPAQRLEQEVLEWADDVYNEWETDLANSRETRITGKLIEYLSGQQWNSKSRFGRSRPTVNRLMRQFVEQCSLLTDIEPDFQVNFLSEDEAAYKLQNLLNESIGLWARMTDFEMELTQSVMWSLLHTGYGKVQWNPAMNGGMGDVEFMPLGPLECGSIGAGKKLQDDECVIARWPVTIESLYRCYGDLAEGVIPDLESNDPIGGDLMRPPKMSQASWVRLPPALKKMLGKRGPNQPRSRYPKAMLKQFWFKDSSVNDTGSTVLVGPEDKNWSYRVEPGCALFPRGRLIVIAGGKVLNDAPNPYWHRMFPFGKLRLIRVPWNSNGASPIEPQAMMQDIINRINGGIMDMIRAAIEPKIMGPKAAFAQSVWDSMDPGAPGSKVAYNNNTPQKPEYVKPPELPAYVLTQKQDIEKEQDASSGGAAINQSLAKKQVPGGDSLEMILGTRSLPIRFMGRGLYSFCTEIGTLVTCTKLQFENARNRVRKFGAKGLVDNDFEPIYGQFINSGMQPEEFVRSVVFEIRKGSLLNIEKQDEVQIGFALRKMGDISRKSLLRKLGLKKAQIEEIESELLVEMQQKLAMAGEASALTHHGKK